jgi:hypothetical protein
MMKAVLKENLQLLRIELETYRMLISSQSPLPIHLRGIHEWLTWFYDEVITQLLNQAEKMLFKNTEVNNEIFKRLQIATRQLRIYHQYTTAIHRYRESDRICYELIGWLHKQHPIVGNKPFAVIDGDFKIYPDEDYPLLYFLPSASQYSLLHLPLFFHEIGHYFYKLKKATLQIHLEQLQIRLQSHFILPFQHNDRKYREQVKKVAIIIGYIWPNWIQELFCDAVGVRIGGLPFIYAASHYLRMGGTTMFHLQSKDIRNSSHPIPWLRMKFICRYGSDLGFPNESNTVLEEWNTMAAGLKLKENYHGCYSDQYYADVKTCIDQMIAEVNPILFTDHNASIVEFDYSKDNFLSLLNLAWREYHQNPMGYSTWESGVIEKIVNSEKTLVDIGDSYIRTGT